MASLFSIVNTFRPRRVIKSEEHNALQQALVATFNNLGDAPLSGYQGVSTPFTVGTATDPKHAVTKAQLDTAETGVTAQAAAASASATSASASAAASATSASASAASATSAASSAATALATTTFTQAGTGAVSRTNQAKMRDTVSVKDFGAVGDGTTDDTAAIQAAIDHIATRVHTYSSLQLGVRLYIPAGTYKTGKLTISSPMCIEGDGSSASRLYLKNSVNDNLLYFNAVTQVVVKGLTLDGNEANNATPAVNSGNGLAFSQCSRVVLEDLEVRSCKGNGWITFGGSYFSFNMCRLMNNGANGTYHTTTSVALDNGTAYISGTNSVAVGNYFDGFCFDPGSATCVLGDCISINNGGTGFNIYGNTSGIYPRDISINGCIAKNNDLEGFSCHAAESVVMSGIQSIDNGRINSGTRIGGIVVSMDAAGQRKSVRLVIDGFLIVGPKGHGIDINSVTSDKVTSVIISDGIIENVGDNASNTWDGISLEDVQNVYISNVYVLDSRGPKKMRYGLATAAGSSTVRVDGGNIGSGLTGDYLLTSTSVLISSEVTTDERSIRTSTLDKGLHIYGNARPRFRMTADGPGTSGRMYSRESSWYSSGLWNNLQWNGSWNLDDVTRPGWDTYTDVNSDLFGLRRASAGANPRTITDYFQVSGTVNSGQTCGLVLVNDGAVTSLRRVLVGAVDSGGTGYRLLRVTN